MSEFDMGYLLAMVQVIEKSEDSCSGDAVNMARNQAIGVIKTLPRDKVGYWADRICVDLEEVKNG